MITKSILLMCLAHFGYSLSYTRPISDVQGPVERCVDATTACYYKLDKNGHKGDVYECLKEAAYKEEHPR